MINAWETQIIGNVIGGNMSAGILMSGSQTMNNQMAANFIGTNCTDTVDLGNQGGGLWIEDEGTRRCQGRSGYYAPWATGANSSSGGSPSSSFLNPFRSLSPRGRARR